MTYALLLWPHSNQRYEEAYKNPAAAELDIILRAAGVHACCRYQSVSGAGALMFEADELNERQLSLISQHSLYYLFGVWENEKAFYPASQQKNAYLGEELASIQKYKGKTNEKFTEQLINLALFSCRFSEGEGSISLLDPMCGRGTTLFQAVNREWNAAGIDADKKDVLECAQFFEKYLKFNKRKHKRTQSSRTIYGKAPVQLNNIAFGGEKGNAHTLTVCASDAANACRIFGTEAFHIIVSDLPYGVQHAPSGEGGAKSFENTLIACLPEWRKALKTGGAVALSYNTHTLKTARVRELMSAAGFEVLSGGAYDRMEHWVEQAVMRDIAVCIKK